MTGLLHFIALALLLALGSAAATPLPDFVLREDYPFAEDCDPQIQALLGRAADLNYARPAEARPLVVEAFALADRGLRFAEYDYAYALYLLLKNGFDGPGSSTFGPGTREDYLRVARRLLDHLDRSGRVGQWVFTPEGQFYIEAHVTAGNGLAWYLYEDAGGDPAKLEEALAIVQRSTAHIQSEQHYFARDTEVRILLALGRRDAAYGIVRDVLAEAPDFADFADLREDPDYRRWLADQR